jgi:putative copper resistance protein D
MSSLRTSIASKAGTASPSADLVADGGLIAARALTNAAMLLGAGLPLYLMSAGRGLGVAKSLRGWLVLLALGGAGASIWWVLASVSAMTALPIGQLDRGTLTAVLAATPLGSVLAIRLAALALLALAALLRLPAPWLAATASIALATSAWTGHAGVNEGLPGAVHRLADVAHLLAAATWLGALAMLLASLLGPIRPHEVERRLRGFARTGTVIVTLLLATGVANILFIAGWHIPVTTDWAILLALKLFLFAVMLAAAALNRWRLTPALAAGSPTARVALRIALGVEAVAGLAIVALVSALGLLDPNG